MPLKRPLVTAFVVVTVLTAGCSGFVPSDPGQQPTTTETKPSTTTSDATTETVERETGVEATTVEVTTQLYTGEPVLSVENVSNDEFSQFDADRITAFENLTEEQQSVFLEAYGNASAEFDGEFDFSNGTWVVKYEGDYYEVVAKNA